MGLRDDIIDIIAVKNTEQNFGILLRFGYMVK